MELHLPSLIPSLSLSRGQLLFAVCYGQDSSNLVRERVQYLSQLGVPGASPTGPLGRGNRRSYNFDDLAEVGVGLVALSYAFRPKDITKALVEDRDPFHRHCAAAWQDLPEDIMTEHWVSSRGSAKIVPEDEFFVRAHDRSSDGFGTFDFISPADTNGDLSLLFEPIERYPGEPVRRLISLTRFLPQWVYWALKAPDIKAGRKS